MDKKKRRILIIKLSSFGDILLATPAIKILRDQNKDSEITMLVNKGCYSIIKNNNDIDKFMIAENIGESRNFFKEGIKIIKTIFMLRKIRFDEAYILHRNKILLNMCKLSRIKKIKVFGNEDVKKGNIKTVKFDLQEHRIYRNIKLVTEKDDYHNYKTDMYFFQSKTSEKLKEFLLQSQKYIVISPGGGKNAWSEMKSRRLDEEKYKEIIKEMLPNNRIVLVGGKDDKDLCDNLTFNENVINVAGETSIDETYDIIKNCILFIGNDSMPLFLAGAANIPLIGLFGPTNGAVINPIGEKFRYIQAEVDCSPCYNPLNGEKDIAYTCSHISCMKRGITVEKVIKEAEELLEKYGG